MIKGAGMPNNKYEILGPKYADIGGELAEIVGGDPNGVFLYAEAGDGWLGYSVFKDDGRSVRYFRPTSELGDLIREARESEEHAKRWAVMEYEIKGNKFDASFKFPEEVDVQSFDIDRREIALQKRFGDKPVIYPPIPEHLLRSGAEEN